MTFVGLLAAYFTLFAAGVAVVLILLRDSSRINAIECACLSWILVFSAWPSYTAHITSSQPRHLLQIVPVGWLAIAPLSWPRAEPANLESNFG
jgi:hypothetical protein